MEVTKVNFHIGDVLFYRGPDALAYRGTAADWPRFVRELMLARGVDGLFVFGDCRPMHRAAIAEARLLGVRVYVLEEGYLRPNWFTLEQHGVNGNSRMPRDPAFYRNLDLPEVAPPSEVGQRWKQLSWYSTLNALAFTLINQGFPHYKHHRSLNAWYHTFIHLRGVVRKEVFLKREQSLIPRFKGELRDRFYLVPLQVHCDFQLQHSPYGDLMDFVRDVAAAFAAHGDPDHSLVFKHHPMDRAYREYGDFFEALAVEHGLEGRLFYIHDLHLPTLLDAARAVITINSTVGLQSMEHGTPVLTMGTAVYDIAGMAFQGSLEEFLSDPGVVDRQLYEAFARYLLHVNQVNGSFYKRLSSASGVLGVRWFPTGPVGFEREHGGVRQRP